MGKTYLAINLAILRIAPDTYVIEPKISTSDDLFIEEKE